MLFHVTGCIEDPTLVPPLVDAEKQVSEELQNQRFTLWAYRRADRPGVYMVVEAESRALAEHTLQRLPFVSGNAMTVDLVEVWPV